MKTQDRLEPHLFQGYWSDGLLDLLAGLGLIGVGLGWAFDQPALGAVVPALLVPLWIPLRRRISEPRAGFVEFSRGRRDRVRKGLVRVLWLGVGALILGAAGYLLARPGGGWVPGPVVAGLPAVLLAVLAGLTGLLTGAARFLVYGLVLVVAGVAVVLLDIGPAPAMLASGVVVATCGVVFLVRFVRSSAAFEERSS